MTPQEAIEIVARMAFVNHGSEPGWEEYPDIDEEDWYAVQEHTISLAAVFREDTSRYVEAYELLASRASRPGGDSDGIEWQDAAAEAGR